MNKIDFTKGSVTKSFLIFFLSDVIFQYITTGIFIGRHGYYREGIGGQFPCRRR